MAQHDYVIANGSGSAVRSDLNNALAAIVSHNSGTSEPTTTYAYMPWADTSAGVMKLRNGANNAWITLYQLDGEYTTIPLENGTAAAPSLYFKTSGTDTGLYSPGTDQVAISTGGTGRLFVSASGDVGFGASSPSNTAGFAQQVQLTGSLPCFTIEQSNSSHTLRKYSIGVDSVGGLGFWDNTASAYRFYVDTSGRVGIGASTPQKELQITAVTPTIRLEESSASAKRLELSINSAAEALISAPQSSSQLLFATSGSERLRITSDGKVGIGTTATSPASLLTSYAGDVSTLGAKTSTGLLIENNGNVGNISQIGLGYTFSSTYHPVAIAAVTNSGSGSTRADLVFAVRDATTDTAPTERLRISSAGQLSAVVPGGSTLYPGFMARAWVNFDGTGTVAIRASGNVSSITDNGAGDYTVNFTTAMADTNYAVCTDCQLQLSVANFSESSQSFSYATGSVRVACGYYLEAGSNNYRDQAYVHVAIFR